MLSKAVLVSGLMNQAFSSFFSALCLAISNPKSTKDWRFPLSAFTAAFFINLTHFLYKASDGGFAGLLHSSIISLSAEVRYPKVEIFS